MITNSASLHAFWSSLCILIALFYLFRLVAGRAYLVHFDIANEAGHGLMALGMIIMLAPASFLTIGLLLWNVLVFAVASLWWTLRLLARKPLLTILLRTNGTSSTFQSDAIHVWMHGGMCYMFLLMISMAFSMTQPAIYANCLFFVSLAFLTFFYGREISKDLQAAKRDWLQLGANLAHLLMSGIMAWMFLEMLSMTMNMGAL
jgi:hypothetical protein